LDTKSKNRVFLIIWLLLVTFGLNSLGLLLVHGEEYLGKDYFDTYNFQENLDEFKQVLSIVELNDVKKSDVMAKLTVSDSEIKAYRNNTTYLNNEKMQIENAYAKTIDKAKASGDQKQVKSLKAERDKKIAEAEDRFHKDDNYIKGKILKNKERSVDKFFNRKKELRPEWMAEQELFLYYFKNSKTGQVFTNLPDGQSFEDIPKNKLLFVKNNITIANIDFDYLNTIFSDIPQGYDQETKDILKSFATPFRGTIGVQSPLPEESAFTVQYKQFNHEKTVFYFMIFMGIIAFIVSLILWKRHRVSEHFVNEKWQSLYNRIPIDICIAALFLSLYMTLLFLMDYSDVVLYATLFGKIKAMIWRVIVVTVTLLQWLFLVTRFRKTDDGFQIWKTSIIYKMFESFMDIAVDIGTGVKTFVLLFIVFCTGIGIPIVINIPQLFPIYVVLFMVITLPALLIVMKRIGHFNRVVQNTEDLVNGKAVPDLAFKGRSGIARLAKNINVLKHGVKVSQEKQAKSERLKTELITNVSHDLRTPLTSIITYAELLKSPDITEDERKTYIEVIDRKSKRLKVLIDDLFEASKMASGAVELIKEKVDLVQLLQQTLAENDERITESKLTFRVYTLEQPIYAIVDGQKLWRVFDNLIGNILKYSLENTRVYIAIMKENGKAVITFKNITKYELSGNIDELFERFKRGDTSRHTEGSGLGLAIAKSIVDLHGGSMDIDVDGDLFKVTVRLATV